MSAWISLFGTLYAFTEKEADDDDKHREKNIDHRPEHKRQE